MERTEVGRGGRGWGGDKRGGQRDREGVLGAMEKCAEGVRRGDAVGTVGCHPTDQNVELLLAAEAAGF
jgi:hypothetical protein